MTPEPHPETDASVVDRYLNMQTIYRVGVYVVMYGLGVMFLVPYWRMFMISISPTSVLAAGNLFIIPPEITLAYFEQQIFEHQVIIRWIANTLFISSVTTVLVLLVDSMIAFSLTRLEWPGQRVILAIVVASFMIPGYVNIIPLFTLINRLNMLNSYWAIILPFAAGPLGVFLLEQFFRDIPEELEDAARLDGFSTLRIYARIILPLSKPILTALGLFMFIWSWNQFLWPLIVLQNERLYTLPIGATTLRTQYTQYPNIVMASMSIISLPLFLVFLFFQDKLISSVQMQVST